MSGRPSGPTGGGRLAEALGSWRAALRIARREARRARGRTTLVLAMIVLPVLALSFVAVSVDMARLTPSEELERRLGNADAELRVVGRGPVEQNSDGSGWTSGDADKPPTAPVTAAFFAALLPEGSRVLPVRRWVPFSAWRGDRIRDDVAATVIDLTDPLGRGLARVHRGRVPAAADEIAVNLAARRSLGVDVGDRVVAADGSRTWTVVGVAELPEQLTPMVLLHPAGAPVETDPDEVFLADLSGPLTDDVFRHLNRNGVVVAARVPAPPGKLPQHVDSPTGRMSLEEVSTGVLIGGLGLLEVVLLVGPAFAVGVRRRRRELALVAVAGGDAVQLRRVVLADGVVLGGVGAVTGIALGVAAAFAGRPLVEQFIFSQRFGGYRVWPAALVVIALVAVLAGVLAALAPAWTAARQDVVAGLAGRRTAPVHRRRWLAIGIALAAGGTVVAAIGAVVTSQPVILAGLVLGELGLVFATPTLVGLLARLGRFLPLAPRIAVRDASRNRASAAPAISAVMAAVAGSVALGLFLASDDARNEQQNRALLPEHTVLVTTGGDPATDRPPTRDEISGPARRLLGADTIAPLVAAGCSPDFYACTITATMPPERVCPWQPYEPLSAADQLLARADPRCQHDDEPHGPYLRVAVDDGTTLRLLTGVAPADVAAATATLRAGGAVITDARFLHDDRLDLRVEHGDETRPADTATVPGHALHTGLGEHWLLLSPAAADRLGLATWQVGWALDARRPPDQQRQDDLAAALRPLGAAGVAVERNRDYDDTRPLLLLLAAVSAVVTVGAAGIATGLAAAEGRADLSTLAAVGAGPGVRRLLSLCQAGVIAVLGSALGIVAGLASALIVLAFTNQRYADRWPIEPPYPLVMPWLTLGVLVVVPLVAMLGAALLTRSRLPVERRLD
ncbi:ABC transporter permease [Verrucosispora sp. WMMA2044]|uniref:FtsX-like permease family protein n=1 Tax=Verrucosispora sp. WMMA2044 TaxID=3016419 RepID=UPI00248C9414|nr:FtsX-like permease family protein [Verrucosispora sp. WMMA2044]WBB47072.1 ABC transporter permease [Verrucosispora sp. WMMA2044]